MWKLALSGHYAASGGKVKQIVVSDIEQLRDLIVGKKIVDVKSGCSISDGIGIEEIVLEGGLSIDLWGAADCTMVECLWQHD